MEVVDVEGRKEDRRGLGRVEENDRERYKERWEGTEKEGVKVRGKEGEGTDEDRERERQRKRRGRR